MGEFKKISRGFCMKLLSFHAFFLIFALSFGLLDAMQTPDQLSPSKVAAQYPVTPNKLKIIKKHHAPKGVIRFYDNPKVCLLQLDECQRPIWVKKDKTNQATMERVLNAHRLLKIIKGNNLSLLDVSVPQVYTDDSGRRYSVEYDKGSTLAQHSIGCTEQHIQQLRTLNELSGYADMFPRNLVMSNGQICIIDTDTAAFDKRVKVKSALDAVLRVVQQPISATKRIIKKRTTYSSEDDKNDPESIRAPRFSAKKQKTLEAADKENIMPVALTGSKQPINRQLFL